MRRAWSFDAAKSARFCRAHLQPIENRTRERHSVHKNRRLGGHEEQNDTSVHEMRRFCGYEQQNDGNFQEKRHFLGRQGGKTKKGCDMHTIAERLRQCVIPVYGSRLGSRPVDQSSPIHKGRMG